jgi:hypothetical protein
MTTTASTPTSKQTTVRRTTRSGDSQSLFTSVPLTQPSPDNVMHSVPSPSTDEESSTNTTPSLKKTARAHAFGTYMKSFEKTHKQTTAVSPEETKPTSDIHHTVVTHTLETGEAVAWVYDRYDIHKPAYIVPALRKLEMKPDLLETLEISLILKRRDAKNPVTCWSIQKQGKRSAPGLARNTYSLYWHAFVRFPTMDGFIPPLEVQQWGEKIAKFISLCDAKATQVHLYSSPVLGSTNHFLWGGNSEKSKPAGDYFTNQDVLGQIILQRFPQYDEKILHSDDVILSNYFGKNRLEEIRLLLTPAKTSTTSATNQNGSGTNDANDSDGDLYALGK